MNWQKFKNLDYISQTGDGAKTAIVLFHGYGADAQDLASLSRVVNLGEPVDWFFPQGVIEVPVGPMMSGRAWFELRVSDFEDINSDSLKDEGIDPGVNATLKQVCEWLNHMGGLYDQVFIGGFSQGAILTSHSFYRLNFKPAGLLYLSGFLIVPSAIPQIPPELQVPFFQSHGNRDEVLPLSGARRLFDTMKGMGLSGKWYEFSGGHEIPMEVIAEMQNFLTSTLNSQEATL